jgi:hypothetical protein
MNSFQIMIGQGSMAVAAIAWGAGATNLNLGLTFAAAAITAVVALVLGRRYSIDFAAEALVEAAPIIDEHEFPVTPEHDDGPVTVAIEYNILNDDREQFRVLMQEAQAIYRRNGAFQCRLDESLDYPGTFRLEYIVSTWAEHLRQNMRMTIDETQVFRKVGELHVGETEPFVRHYLSTERFMHLEGFGFSGRTFINTSRMPKPKARTAAVASGAR